MRIDHVWLARGATLAIALFGCSTPRNAAVGSPASSRAGEMACSATLGKLPAGTTVASIGGDYRFTLVATSGPRAGMKASGTLTLDLPSGSASAMTTLAGTASVALDSVAAKSPSMRSPGRYDITALQWSSTTGGVTSPEITIRYGTVSSPGTTRPIEGVHMAMHLNAVTADGFSGRWDSGTGEMQQGPAVAGHFCAVK